MSLILREKLARRRVQAAALVAQALALALAAVVAPAVLEVGLVGAAVHHEPARDADGGGAALLRVAFVDGVAERVVRLGVDVGIAARAGLARLALGADPGRVRVQPDAAVHVLAGPAGAGERAGLGQVAAADAGAAARAAARDGLADEVRDQEAEERAHGQQAGAGDGHAQLDLRPDLEQHHAVDKVHIPV